MKLKEKGWHNEQMIYAYKKYKGERTGMWEIPVFKFLENRKVKEEIELRKKIGINANVVPKPIKPFVPKNMPAKPALAPQAVPVKPALISPAAASQPIASKPALASQQTQKPVVQPQATAQSQATSSTKPVSPQNPQAKSTEKQAQQPGK